MYIAFRNKPLLQNLTSKNTEKKFGNSSYNNFLKPKNKNFSRNLNINSLDKLKEKSKIYLHTINNNKIIRDKNVANSHKNILNINNLFNKNNGKSINFTSSKSETKYFLTDSNFFQNNENKKTNISNNPISVLFDNKNSKNFQKNHKNKRYSITQIPNIKYNIRKSLSNSENNGNIISQRKSLNSVVSNRNLKDKISQLIKEISNNKTGIKHFDQAKAIHNKKSSGRIKSRNKNKLKIKSIDSMAKKNRNKFFNLLNKDGSLNSFLKTMKIKTTSKNIMNNISANSVPKVTKIMRRPKNTVEMNKLLINSFALNKGGSNEFSKNLFSLNETFFSIMNELKIAKAEMELEKLDKISGSGDPINIETIKKREKKWEKQFLLNMYKNKLSEKEFKTFKKMNKIQQKKEIMKESLQLADNIMKMDADEYEVPNELFEFRSTRSFVSNVNVYRIRRIKRIMKNIEDKEQLGAYDVNVEKLKKDQKISETEGMLAIKKAGSGKPRFVKTQFKASTISKYKGISGDFFGLPA